MVMLQDSLMEEEWSLTEVVTLMVMLGQFNRGRMVMLQRLSL